MHNSQASHRASYLLLILARSLLPCSALCLPAGARPMAPPVARAKRPKGWPYACLCQAGAPQHCLPWSMRTGGTVCALRCALDKAPFWAVQLLATLPHPPALQKIQNFHTHTHTQKQTTLCFFTPAGRRAKVPSTVLQEAVHFLKFSYAGKRVHPRGAAQPAEGTLWRSWLAAGRPARGPRH